MDHSSEAARPETQARELNNGGDGSGGAIAEGWFLQRVVSASLVVVIWPPALAGGERDGRRGVAVAELARGVAVASLARLLPSSTDDPRASAAASLTHSRRANPSVTVSATHLLAWRDGDSGAHTHTTHAAHDWLSGSRHEAHCHRPYRWVGGLDAQISAHSAPSTTN